jgi:hypothetical protein
MMFQIEFVINEFSKTSEKITNLIHHEYIERSFLLSRLFMPRTFCTFMIEKLGLLNMRSFQKIVSNHWFCQKICTKLFYFIYSYYVGNFITMIKWHFACIMSCKHINPYSILLKINVIKLKMSNMDFKDNVIHVYL